MQKKHSYNALKVLQIIRAILLIIMSIMVISTAIIGHCASEQDYFPMFQNNNSKFTDPLINYIENTLNSNDNYIFCSYSGIGNPNSPNYKTYEFLYISIPKNANTILYGEKYNDLIHFSLYKVGSANPTGGYIKYNPHFGTFDNITYSGILNYFQNLTSSNYDNNKDYVSNFQVMTNNTSTAQVVLFYDDGVTIPDGDTAREDMEKPQISDYIPNWTNRPTFDGSSLENALQSVYNGIVWLGDNIKDTITGVGEFIGDTMRWAIQKIINTVRDVFEAVQCKINEVKNGILTVADKIQNTFDYISQPLQTTQVVTAMQSTDIHTDIVSVVNLSNTAFGIFGTVSEPQNFTIPLDLTGISILHQTQPFYIDLSWIIDARQYIRAFMWCIVTFGLLYSIVVAIPSMLKDSK